MVAMEGAQTFMSRNLESKPLRDSLNGKVAKLLKFFLIHFQSSIFDFQSFFNLRYSSVLVYSPVWFE